MKKMIILCYILVLASLAGCVPTSNASNTVAPVYNEVEIIENTNENIDEFNEVEQLQETKESNENELTTEKTEEIKEISEESTIVVEEKEISDENVEEEDIIVVEEEDIPVAPIVTPAPVTTAEPTPTPTPVPAEKPEVIEEENKNEVETPTANITIVEDVDLSQDLQDLWKQYPENHFNQKTDSYIYYQSTDNFVEIHIQNNGDYGYMISGSTTSGAEDMDASQFAIIKKTLEATVENSEELYAKYIEAYKAMYGNKTNDPQAIAQRKKWAQENTSNEDGIEKWKTLGNIEYKFELGRGVEMHYKAK